MRLMRHKSTDLGLGTYDMVEVDECRAELERLPVAVSLLLAAGSEHVTVPVAVRPGPVVAAPGRAGPEHTPSRELVGPAGLEPATAKSQAFESGQVTETASDSTSTGASTPLAGTQQLAEAVLELLAARRPQLPRSLRRELARLLLDDESDRPARAVSTPPGEAGSP